MVDRGMLCNGRYVSSALGHMVEGMHSLGTHMRGKGVLLLLPALTSAPSLHLYICTGIDRFITLNPYCAHASLL